jgi:hypothetical protein
MLWTSMLPVCIFCDVCDGNSEFLFCIDVGKKVSELLQPTTERESITVLYFKVVLRRVDSANVLIYQLY